MRAWKPEVPGIREVFHARFVDHAYPARTHDAWTVFTVDEDGSRTTSAPRDGSASEPPRRETGLADHSIHSVTISAAGWMLIWRVTPSLDPLKL